MNSLRTQHCILSQCIFFISRVRLRQLGSAVVPQMIDDVIVEQLVEWRLVGETEVLREDLPNRYFVHHKSHMTRSGQPRWEASD
jgi:hypothetical protein